MKTTLKSISLFNKKKENNNDKNNPTYYLDLQQSEIEVVTSSTSTMNDTKIPKSSESFPLYYRGSILRFNFKLVFKNLLPEGSSVAIFSAQSTTKSFNSEERIPLLQKIGTWIKTRTKNLWLTLILQKPTQFNLNEFSTIQHHTIDEDFDESESDALQPISSTMKSTEREDIDLSKQIIEDDFNIYRYKSFFTNEDITSYKFSMNLDSKGFNVVIPSSEAIWISLKPLNGSCEPLALKIPEICLKNMIYIIAQPAYLRLHGKNTIIRKVFKFSRNDNALINIYHDVNTKLPNTSVKKMNEDSIEIKVNLKSLKKSKQVFSKSKIAYLRFFDTISSKKLSAIIPIVLDN
ncbi:MAG: hypothetical protein GF353_13990 [Candidatus Lokiarchaeota archaeon]|nr:hypothetical protein [Candidatus Lokiarchaeota archaeon]